jgi:S1-C subfamily serine protease
VITALAAQRPAATAGLKIGDTITKINGNNLTDDGFQSQISTLNFGSNVAITYMRGAWASIGWAHAQQSCGDGTLKCTLM